MIKIVLVSEMYTGAARIVTDTEAFKKLIESMKTEGQLEPIPVELVTREEYPRLYKMGIKYHILDGTHRWLIAQALGWSTLIVDVKECISRTLMKECQCYPKNNRERENERMNREVW